MGHVFRTEEQQAAVDGLRRFLDDKVEPVFNKEYRDKFVPREKMGAIMRELTQFGLVSGVISEAKRRHRHRLAHDDHVVRGSRRHLGRPVGAGTDELVRCIHG